MVERTEVDELLEREKEAIERYDGLLEEGKEREAAELYMRNRGVQKSVQLSRAMAYYIVAMLRKEAPNLQEYYNSHPWIHSKSFYDGLIAMDRIDRIIDMLDAPSPED